MRSELLLVFVIAFVASACGKKAADLTVDAVAGLIEDAVSLPETATGEFQDATPTSADVTATAE